MSAGNPSSPDTSPSRGHLKVGDFAPDFELPVFGGGTFRLSEAVSAGDRVLLVFLRHLA